MQALADTLFVILSGPWGWVAGAAALLVTIGLVAMMGRVRALRGWKLRAIVLVVGLVGAALLAAPFAINASRMRSPLGPEAFQRATLTLPAPGVPGRVIGMDLWFPAQGPATIDAGRGCDALRALPLSAKADEAIPLVLYIARFKGDRADNIARMEELASHGYIVAAIDDIALDDPDPDASAQEAAARLHDWPQSSDEEIQRSVALNTIRAGMEARKALAALDSLAACAASLLATPWSEKVDYDRVGFTGFSFGGAAATEAAIIDPRVAAVANIDGTLFGKSFSQDIGAPYLFLRRDNSFPSAEALASGPMEQRGEAYFAARDLARHARLADQPGSGAYRINGADHSSFSDALFEPHASRQWLLHDPISTFDATNAYLLDFLDMHLRGTTPRLIGKPTTDNLKVDSFEELGVLAASDP